jgi:hypothetical protein
MPSVTVDDFFNEEYRKHGLRVFAGGKDVLDTKPLEPSEISAIRLAFRSGINQLARVSPKLAQSFSVQEDAIVKWGQIAKAVIPNDKPITYPARSGTLGVSWICPAVYGYYAGASAETVGQWDYSQYANKASNAIMDNWSIALTGGTARYLAGNGTNYYKAMGTENYRAMHVILQDGILQLGGAAPSISQIRFRTEAMNKYSPIGVQPLVAETIEEGKQIYQYPTLGMIPMYHNFGTEIGVMPGYTATVDMPLAAMTFYEYDLWSTLKT